MLTYLVYVWKFRDDPTSEPTKGKEVWFDPYIMPHLITTDPQKACDHAVDFFFGKLEDPTFYSMTILRGEQEVPHDRIFEVPEKGDVSPYLMFHIRRYHDQGWSAMVWDKDYARLIDQEKLRKLAEELRGDLVWLDVKDKKPA